MFGMSNDEMYRRIEHQLDFRKDDIGRYLEVMIDIVGEQNKNIGEHKEWLSDIANRLEATLANKKENQALKQRIEELEGEHRELDDEHRELQEQYKWLMKEMCNLIEEILKKED